MTETGWQAIGRIAKERRERLGLRQDELAQYGGPRVSTVGKFERGAQDNFPLRTQHQMEKALGWGRTIVEQVVSSIDDGTLTVEDWEYDLVHENIPDLSRPSVPEADEMTRDPLGALSYILKLIPLERRDEAVRQAIAAMLVFLDLPGATQLGTDLRGAFPPRTGGEGDGYSAPTRQDLALAAHDEPHSIEDEQNGNVS